MTREKKQSFTRRITQANASGLVVIVYEIALDSMDEALGEEKASEEFRKALQRAADCVINLQKALKPEYAISKNLLALYGFVLRELSRARASGNKEAIENAKKVIGGLYPSFLKLAEEDDSEALMENTQNVYAGLTYGRGELTESRDPGADRGFLA